MSGVDEISPQATALRTERNRGVTARVVKMEAEFVALTGLPNASLERSRLSVTSHGSPFS